MWNSGSDSDDDQAEDTDIENLTDATSAIDDTYETDIADFGEDDIPNSNLIDGDFETILQQFQDRRQSIKRERSVDGERSLAKQGTDQDPSVKVEESNTLYSVPPHHGAHA